MLYSSRLVYISKKTTIKSYQPNLFAIILKYFFITFEVWQNLKNLQSLV